MRQRAVLSVLLLLAAAGARAAVVSDGAANCPAVRTLLLEKGVDEAALTGAGSAGEVCEGADSCCSTSWENGIKSRIQQDFRKHLLDSTDKVKSLLHHQVIDVQDAILKAIHTTNESTIQRHNEDRRDIDDVTSRSIPALFGNFMRYFQSQLSDPQLEQAITVFFDDLFVATYQDRDALNATMESCLRERRQQLRPFRDLPYRMQEQLLRTFGLARFYLQSLYGGLRVLNATTEFEASESCHRALARLTYCPLCRGLGTARPCTGFCVNAMHGCMAPLSTLTQSWEAYVDVLRKLATSLQAANNVESYLFKIYINISEAMTSVWNRREELDRLVAEACSGQGTSPAEPTRRRRQVDMQYRSSGDLGGALPPLPSREHLINLEGPDEPQLNKLLRTFNSDVNRHRNLFRNLPTRACDDDALNGEPDKCWNGEELGDYSKPLAGVGLDSQSYNPEVTVPETQDPALRAQADLLDQIHQGSNDKLASLPPVDDLHWGDSFYDSDGSGDGSGDYPYVDDEDEYYFSGSGEQYPDDDYPPDQDPDGTLPPPLHDGDEDIDIPEEPSVGGPVVPVEPAPPTTAPPAREATKKPAAAAAAAAVSGCWALVAAAALLAGMRL